MSGPAHSPIGAYIRQQRQLARLSLREMARLSQVSNAYLSQIERGLHEPSMRVLNAVADVLAIPVEELVRHTRATPPKQDGRPDDDGAGVVAAIRADRRLSTAQKEALLAVYRGFVGEDEPGATEE